MQLGHLERAWPSWVWHFRFIRWDQSNASVRANCFPLLQHKHSELSTVACEQGDFSSLPISATRYYFSLCGYQSRFLPSSTFRQFFSWLQVISSYTFADSPLLRTRRRPSVDVYAMFSFLISCPKKLSRLAFPRLSAPFSQQGVHQAWLGSSTRPGGRGTGSRLCWSKLLAPLVSQGSLHFLLSSVLETF